MWLQTHLLRSPHSHTNVYLEGNSLRTVSLTRNYNAVLGQQLSRPSNESLVWPYSTHSFRNFWSKKAVMEPLKKS